MSIRGAILAIALAAMTGCTAPTQTGAPASLAPIPTSQASLPAASQPGATAVVRPTSPALDGAGSIVYVADWNVWVAAPDGSFARQLTTDGTESSNYHDPSQADDGTIIVLKGLRELRRLDRSGSALAAPVSLITLENGAEGLAAAPDGTRLAYATVGSGQYVDPRFGTPSGIFLYGGTDVANLDGTSVPGAVMPSLIYPSWIDQTHLLATDGVDIYVDEVGPAEPATWLSLDEGCVTDFDCPTGDEASASISTPAISPDGRVLSYSYRPYFGPAGRRMATLDGLPPAAPETSCVIAGQEHHSDPGAFSSDASVFLYDDTRFDPDEFETVIGEGIWMMSVDLASPDCGASSARLVVPGGSQPDWGNEAP